MLNKGKYQRRLNRYYRWLYRRLERRWKQGVGIRLWFWFWFWFRFGFRARFFGRVRVRFFARFRFGFRVRFFGRFGFGFGFIIRTLMCVRRRKVAVTFTAIMTVEVLWPTSFAIITSLTNRFAVSAIVAIKAVIVAATIARLTNFGKFEGEVILGIELIIRIWLFNRVDSFRVDLYTGRYE